MTRGEKVIRFIERYCLVPEGDLVGHPVKLIDFQRRFILDVYDNPAGTRKAYLSMARKNAKTATIAMLALAHVCGPEAVLNSRVVSGARSKEQAAEVFNYACKMVQLSPELSRVVRIVPSGKRLIGLARNVEYQALSAEGKTAHGKSPIVAILDEVGQVRGTADDFIDAIVTAQGAYTNPLLFAISTQAPNDSDLFSVWLDDAKASNDPRIVCHLYAAPHDADVLDPKAWAAANPALGVFRSLKDVQENADRAHRMPSFESTFRNLYLNQRVEVNQPFVTKAIWRDNGGEPDTLQGKPVFGGLDLSSVSDLTALVLATPDGDVMPTFWLPSEGLIEKSRADRVPYDLWASQGNLLTTPGKAIQYEYIAEYLRGVFDRYDIQAIAFDRYNMRFLKPWLEKVGFSESELERFVEFGQGFVSMSPALRELESRLLSGKLRHGNHPVLTMCAANATVINDSTGNRKFAKGKSTGRIDGMVALAMAIGVMPQELQGDLDGFINGPLILEG